MKPSNSIVVSRALGSSTIQSFLRRFRALDSNFYTLEKKTSLVTCRTGGRWHVETIFKRWLLRPKTARKSFPPRNQRNKTYPYLVLFLVFPPPYFAMERQDPKADASEQNCVAAYADTCQARIRCTTALRIGAPENGVIRNYTSSSSGLEARSAIMAERSS